MSSQSPEPPSEMQPTETTEETPSDATANNLPSNDGTEQSKAILLAELDQLREGCTSLEPSKEHALTSLQAKEERAARAAATIPPPALTRTTQRATAVMGPGAYYARPRGRTPTEDNNQMGDDETSVPHTPQQPSDRPHSTQQRQTPHETAAIPAELVAATPVVSDESQLTTAAANIAEVYKAEQVVDSISSSVPSRTVCSIVIGWALVCLCLGIGFAIVASVLFRQWVSEVESSEQASLEPASMVNLTNYSQFTQYVVFLGTEVPSVCATTGVAITIRCESDDAVLILDQANQQWSNMESWEFVSDQEARCSQTPGREFSYVSFACAWKNADTEPIMGSVAIDDLEADCRASPEDELPVITGMSLGRLCPGPFNNVLYDPIATTCPATVFRDGCVTHRPCRECTVTGWKVVNEMQPSEGSVCRADSLSTTVFGDQFDNPHVLDEFETIVDDHRRFYKLTDEEG